MARILIVDDDLNIRHLFRCLLERAGHEVLDANDGEVALRVFKETLPQLMITDVLMPNKEGLELIQEVKALQPNVSVIALSGGGVVDINDCLAFADGFGADKVFAKPIKPHILLEAVKKCLTTEPASSVSACHDFSADFDRLYATGE